MDNHRKLTKCFKSDKIHFMRPLFLILIFLYMAGVHPSWALETPDGETLYIIPSVPEIKRTPLSESSGVVNKLIGQITLPGVNNSKDDIVEAIKQHFKNNPNLLAKDLNISDFVVNYAHFVPRNDVRKIDTSYIDFRQKTKDGAPIAETHLKFTVKSLPDKSEIVSGTLITVPGIEQELPPKGNVPVAGLKSQATKILNIDSSAIPVFEEEIVRFIDEEQQWRRLYEVGYKENPSITLIFDTDSGELIGKREATRSIGMITSPHARRAFIQGAAPDGGLPPDDKDPGLDLDKFPGGWEPLDDDDDMTSPGYVKGVDIHGSISAAVVFDDDLTFSYDIKDAPFVDTEVKINGPVVTHSDENGHWQIIHDDSGGNLSVELKSKWARIAFPPISSISKLSFSQIVSFSDSLDIHFDILSEFDAAQTTSYYHVNNTHNEVKEILDTDLFDINLLIEANDNASYFDTTSGAPIYCTNYYFFYLPSISLQRGNSVGPTQCINAGVISDLSIELYAYFMDDYAGGFPPGILGDSITIGNSQALAAILNEDPAINEGYLGIAPITTALNPYVFPYTGKGGSFDLAQAWIKFVWALRENLIVKYGKEKGTYVLKSIYFPTILANPFTIPVAVLYVIDADDDDADLTNLTPNFTEIKNAAEPAGLYPLKHGGIANMSILEGASISKAATGGTFDIFGVADSSPIVAFSDYELSFKGPNGPWNIIAASTSPVLMGGKLGTWNISNLPLGDYFLRILVRANSAPEKLLYELLKKVTIVP